jgi:hypothetical protein
VKKGIIFILLIIFLVFVSTKIVFAAASYGKFFGGRITNIKATEILALESSGFICAVPGSTISILPIGSSILTPSDYFIPSYITSKTGTIPSINQYILGRYSTVATIPCTSTTTPPVTKTVSLYTIDLFGTSRQ